MSNENNLDNNGQLNSKQGTSSGSEHSSHHHSHSHHHSSSHRSSSHYHSSYSQPYGYGSSSSKSRRWKKRNKNAVNYSRKKKGSVSKSNKLKLIIAIIICILILVAIAAYEIYTAFILPNYVKPVLEEVVTVMQDDKYTSGITKEIQRLYDIGQISGPEIEQYLEQHTNKPDETSQNEVPSSEQQTTPAPKTNSGGGSSALGINSVNVIDEGSSQGSSKVHYYSSGNKKDTLTPDNTVSMSELQTMSSDELYAKAKSIMSAEDFSAAMALRSKISVSKVKELRNDSNALMQYIQTVLTADEYSNMLYIYAKYSNHLTN